jgi:hypothetical protein
MCHLDDENSLLLLGGADQFQVWSLDDEPHVVMTAHSPTSVSTFFNIKLIDKTGNCFY